MLSNKLIHFLFIEMHMKHYNAHEVIIYIIQRNLAIKRSDITKPSYNKVILLVPALYISLFF